MNYIGLVLIVLFVIFLYNFNEVKENFSHYPMCGGKCNYYKRPNPLFVYPNDDIDIASDYQYTMIAKDTSVPPVISDCSFGACGAYRMCGVAQHLRNSSFRLILWEERMPSGGPVVYNYMLMGGGSGGQNSQKLQTDKELQNGDEIHIVGYPGKFRITLNYNDVPYPYTLQPNVI